MAQAFQPIACVIASVRELDALASFLEAVPVDSGVAFVIIARAGERLEAGAMQCLTALPVVEAEDGALLEANRVYLLPENRNISIARDRLKIRLDGGAFRHPIDTLLCSLAAERGGAAAGVALCGSGYDGALGLKEVKFSGGVTFAVPSANGVHGMVDRVLPAAEIATEILRIAGLPQRRAALEDEVEYDVLQRIAAMMSGPGGIPAPDAVGEELRRLVLRRMVLQKLRAIREYEEFLSANPAEVESLVDELQIGQSTFFEHPESFDALRDSVFPKLFAQHDFARPLRIWVVGCSTGEEAYSLAIELTEYAEAVGTSAVLQIFGTDLNTGSLQVARRGLYPARIAAGMPRSRLHKYFEEVNGAYQVVKPIRESCVFARHNVLTDPPFFDLDLVSCRRLLTYLQPVLQQRLLPVFHYALRHGGHLMLGATDSLGAHRELFSAEDTVNRIYAKAAVKTAHSELFPIATASAHSNRASGEADHILLSKYAPPAVIIDSDLRIMAFRGDTSGFLQSPPGTATLNLADMARDGLLPRLLTALHRAREGMPARERDVHVTAPGGEDAWTHLNVIPLETRGGSYLVIFEPAGKRQAAEALSPVEAELAATREHLSVVLAREHSTENARSDEVRERTVEELQISREELQSSQEELMILNEELQVRGRNLWKLDDDVVELLAGLDAAMLIVDTQLRLRRYTPLAAQWLGLAHTDIGRPLDELEPGLHLGEIEQILRADSERPRGRSFDVRASRGGRFAVRLSACTTREGDVQGVLMMLVPQRPGEPDRLSEALLDAMREPAVVLDVNLCVLAANTAFNEFFQVSLGELAGRPLDLIGGHSTPEPLAAALADALEGSVSGCVKVDADVPRIGRCAFEASVRPVPAATRESGRVLLCLHKVEGETHRTQHNAGAVVRLPSNPINGRRS